MMEKYSPPVSSLTSWEIWPWDHKNWRFVLAPSLLQHSGEQALKITQAVELVLMAGVQLRYLLDTDLGL